MATVEERLRCGGCGASSFSIYHVRDSEDECRVGGGPFSGKLVVVCDGCTGRSELGALPVKLEVLEVSPNMGVICGGWT